MIGTEVMTEVGTSGIYPAFEILVSVNLIAHSFRAQRTRRFVFQVIDNSSFQQQTPNISTHLALGPPL